MYVLNNICFVCLTDSDKNLKTVEYKETGDKIFTHVKYALPELATLNCDLPTYICESCSITLGNFCSFKKKCLQNYSQWKHYIQILQETNNFQNHTYSELQIKVTNCEAQIKQQQELDIKVNIKEENPFRGNEEQIFNDFQIKIDDDIPIKQDPELDIISNIKYTNETVVEDNIFIKELIAEEEEIFTVTLNIRDENEDAFLSSQEQSDEKIEEELLASEENNCEIISDDEQDGELKCLMCNKMCSNKLSFDSHLRNHINNAKGLKCSICKRKLPDTSKLKRHLKFHFGINKEYERALKRYIRHTRKKILECGLCNKTFLSKSRFETHKKIHLDIRDYECAICGKKFVLKDTLSVHLKWHSGRKEFECNICNKKFIQKCNMKAHMKNHSLIKEFECTICSNKFPNKRLFKAHMKNHGSILYSKLTEPNDNKKVVQ